jgi:hypothetical protein
VENALADEQENRKVILFTNNGKKQAHTNRQGAVFRGKKWSLDWELALTQR